MYWGLFANDGPTEDTGYEWKVVDNNGEELRYDNQAAEPVLTLERYGSRILLQEDEYATKLGNHLLAEARTYKDVVEKEGSSHPWWAFPEHQIRPHWSQQEAENFGRIQAVRLYCTHTVIARNGSTIISHEEDLAAQINDSSTYINRSAC